jgi:glutamine synthetase
MFPRLGHPTDVRAVAPDSNPYMVMYAIFKPGLDGEIAKIKSLRSAQRYLPDNIYTCHPQKFRATSKSTRYGIAS